MKNFIFAVTLTTVLTHAAVPVAFAAPQLGLRWQSTGTSSVFSAPGNIVTLEIFVLVDRQDGLSAAFATLVFDAASVQGLTAIECPSPPNPVASLCALDPGGPFLVPIAPGVTIDNISGSMSAFDASVNPPGEFDQGILTLGRASFQVTSPVPQMLTLTASVADGSGGASVPSSAIAHINGTPQLPELTGSWQVNYTCDDDIGGTTFFGAVQTGEDVTLTRTTCGSTSFAGEVRLVSSCSSTPNPLTAELYSGSPTTAIVVDPAIVESVLAVPFSLNTSSCGVVNIDTIRTTSTNMGWTNTIYPIPVGSVRTEGVIDFIGSADLISSGVVCETVDQSMFNCTTVGRRNDLPIGPSQTVTPADGVDITFDNVIGAGTVEATFLSQAAGQIPANFQVVDPPIFYQITTNASITGSVIVCLPYSDVDQDGKVDGTGIVETTLIIQKGGIPLATTIYEVQNQACVTVTSFSEFAVGVTVTQVPSGSEGLLAALASLLVGVAIRSLRVSKVRQALGKT